MSSNKAKQRLEELKNKREASLKKAINEGAEAVKKLVDQQNDENSVQSDQTVNQSDTKVKEDKKEDKKEKGNNQIQQSDEVKSLEDVEKAAREKRDGTRHLIEVLKTKEDSEKEIQKEILQKAIPTYTPNDEAVKKLSEIKIEENAEIKQLFRLFEPEVVPIYANDGRKTLITAWYWKLKKDDIPTGDYTVREYFLSLYIHVIDTMPPYIMLRSMAVDNKHSREAGKVVDAETASILERLFADEQTDAMTRRYIAEMRHRVNAEANVVRYQAVLHPVDYEFNQYFLEHQILRPLTTREIFQMIPTRMRNDVNYIFTIDNSFLETARYVPYNLLQDRLNLHEGLQSIWETLTLTNYVHARTAVPDLVDLVDTETQIKEMSQMLQLEAMTIQSESQFITGINSDSANEFFKTVIAACLAQRTLRMEFTQANYMSLLSGMFVLALVPNELILRESLNSLQVAIINTILCPAFDIPAMQYNYLEIQTPFELILPRIVSRQVRDYLHHVNNNHFLYNVVDGVRNASLQNIIRSGAIVQNVAAALLNIAGQPFRAYNQEYKRSIQRAITILTRRAPQIEDSFRMLIYNYEVIQRFIVMNQQYAQTINTELVNMTAATSYFMLMSNRAVYPDASVLLQYYKVNIRFLHNYNEAIDDTVATLLVSHRLNLYQKKILSLVTEFMRKLKIFDAPKIPPDQMYLLRNRMRQLPVEQRRADVYNIMETHRTQIERASKRIAQGVVLMQQEAPLQHDPIVGYTNVTRNLDGYRTISLEELQMRGDFQPLTDVLLANQPIALQGAITYKTETDPFAVLAKSDVAVFAPIIKERNLNALNPISYEINSDSKGFYIVHNNSWVPTSNTKLFKQPPRKFVLSDSTFFLESGLFYTIFTDPLSFISHTSVEPVNAVAFDGHRIVRTL